MEQFSLEQLQSYPSLRGRFPSANVKLTDLERAVALYQGLLDENGKLKPEAIAEITPTLIGLPPDIAMPISLAELVPDKADEIEAKINEARGNAAPAAAVKPENKIGGGLPPPDVNAATEEQHVGPGPLPLPEKVTAQQAIATSESPVMCSHCGWDQRNNFKPPKIAEDEKAAFVRHLMSVNGRFYKSYDLCGGALRVTLRSRSHKEIEMILDQARKDLKNEQLTGAADLQAQLQRYHVCASIAQLESLQDPGQADSLRKFTNLADYNPSAGPPVTQMVSTVFADMSEGLFSILNTHWFEFEKLYGYLTSRAPDSDFWKAVAGDR